MIPNVDPRTMKAMMTKMGIKSSEIDAKRVIIECNGADIVIDNPQVTKIEMQGITTFQVAGDVSETLKSEDIKISDEDIELVKEKTGINDADLVRKALEDANGDIAQAIVELENDDE
jgi:nascent polypeptide-associated complex subunit alpha